MPDIKIGGIVIGILAVAAIALAIVYLLFYSPKARTLKHLEFVHESIAEMHPGMLLSDNFRELHQNNYRKAVALLPEVKNSRDMDALLGFYLAQYQDKHLGGGLAQSVFLNHNNIQPQWTGWTIGATADGFYVDYRLNEPNIPPLDAKLISCNGIAVDRLLREHYAPYHDTRWSILNARNSAAKRLTQISNNLHVLKRPPLQECVFATAEGEQSYSVDWRERSESDAVAIGSLSAAQDSPPKVEKIAEGVHWVYATDFQLNSPEAAQNYQQLLTDLQSLESPQAIVFDLRGNQGGNSAFGNEILQALVGDTNMTFIEHRYLEQLPNMDARFRASWKFYWSYDWLLRQAIANQGEDSSMVEPLQNLQARHKQALENNQDFFWQSEWNTEDTTPDSEFTTAWQFEAKTYVVTDRYCISAGLDFMDLLKQIPGLVHVGEPTDADTAYTQVAPMWHEYAKEAYRFAVPIKQWNKRLREDNQPYLPDIPYAGNIYDTRSLQDWILTMQQTQASKTSHTKESL